MKIIKESILENYTSPPPGGRKSITTWLGTTMLGALIAFGGGTAHAAAPPAGTNIGNQALATFIDGANIRQETKSNNVLTIVSQVGSLTLTNDNTKVAAVGNIVYMPHVLTNTGNATDTFTLKAADGGSNSPSMTAISIYHDPNGTGIGNGTALCSASSCANGVQVSVAGGSAYNFVVAYLVPGSAVSPWVGKGTVSATGAKTEVYDPAKITVTNTDNLKFEHRLDDKTQLKAEALYNGSSLGGVSSTSKGAAVSVQQRLGEDLVGEIGLRTGQQSSPTAASFSYGSVSSGNGVGGPSMSQANVASSNLNFTSVRGRLSSKLPGVPEANVFVEAEQGLNQADKRALTVGGNYQLSDTARVYGRYALISSLYNNPYDANTTVQNNVGLLGVETAYMEGGRFFNEYRMVDTIDGRAAQGVLHRSRADRLLQHRCDLHALGRLQQFIATVSRDHDDRSRRTVAHGLLHAAHGLHSVHDRHLPVHQHQVIGLAQGPGALQRVQGLRATRDGVQLRVHRAHDAAQHLAGA